MTRVAPTAVYEIPKEALTAATLVYPKKAAGRYGWTTVAADQNATLVKDTASGDVYFTDSVVAGMVVVLIRGRMAVSALPLV